MTSWHFDYPDIHEPHAEELVTMALNYGSELLIAAIKENLADHDNTHNLMNSWGYAPSAGPGDPSIVYSVDPASIFLDKGTRDHGPKKAKAMGPWEDPGVDVAKFKVVFARHVEGIAAENYVAKSVAESTPERLRYLSMAVERAVRGIFTGEIDATGFALEGIKATPVKDSNRVQFRTAKKAGAKTTPGAGRYRSVGKKRKR